MFGYFSVTKAGICPSPRYGPTMNTYSVFCGLGTLANISNKCSSVDLPATLTRGLGLLYVCGLMRVPHPAMGMTIFRVSAKNGLQL